MKKTRAFSVSVVALLFLGGGSPAAPSQKTVSVTSPLGASLQGGSRTVQAGSQGSEGAVRLSRNDASSQDDDKNKNRDDDKKDKKPKKPKKPKSPHK
jgi:hypothetical protein